MMIGSLSLRAGVTALTLSALCVSACVTHSPRRTYDYAEIPSKLPADCKVEEPPAHCKKLHLPSSCQAIRIPPLDDCGPPYYGTSPADSRACTTIGSLQATSKGPDELTEADRVACFSHERHQPLAGTPVSFPRPHNGFDLHIIEFDDEGRPWNADRIDLTLQRLQQDLEEPSVVVTFVHGWKNDSSVCNGNISCFREVLEVLAKLEKAFEHLSGRAARPVIGIYVGWRGGSIAAPTVKQLSFWGRKHTAHAIGDNGAVTAFIGRLRRIVDLSTPRNTEGASRNTTVISVGHSFGAALLYSALATSLNRQVGEALQDAMAGTGPAEQSLRLPNYKPQQREASLSQALVSPGKCVKVSNTGDLVVLVNPAMEASRFANLNQASHLCYQPEQLPILLTLGSEADYAVGFFFPIGQSLSTLFRSARSRPAWLSMAEGFGMYKPYLTHRLALKTEAPSPAPEKKSGHCRCSSNVSRFGDALVINLEELYKTILVPKPSDKQAQLAAYREFKYSRLEPARDVDPNNPFLMVEVDRKIIGSHSGIFNARFMDFLIEFVARTELKRELTGDYTASRSR